MRILIDILHPADVNFFKNAIDILDKKHADTEIIVRPRGRLIEILNSELYNKQFTPIGRHYTSVLGKVFDLVARTFTLSMFLRKKDFDVATSFGFFMGLAAYFYRKPSVLFVDDYEYKFTYNLCKFSADYLVTPACIPSNGNNILRYNGFKELAYLHPNYFKPEKKVLKRYGVIPKNYVFIREVSGISLNYRNLQSIGLPEIINSLNELGLKVILSLEDKKVKDILKDKCTILEEPVDDIFSLLSFALFTISSGDSMARESCLVGTPTIYTGGRDMIMNQELIKKSCMFKVNKKQDLNDAVTNIIEKDIKKETKNTIKRAIKHEWMDTTKVIVDTWLAAANKDESVLKRYKHELD